MTGLLEELKAALDNPAAILSRNGSAEDGAALLDDVAAFIARYVACSPAGRDAGALWTVHTHAFEAADVSPRFAPQSVEPQSGKTRYLEVLKLLNPPR
jgi:hypothetical protein